MTPEKREKKTRSREETVRRRVIALAVTAAVLLLLAVGLKLWVREPDVPAQPTEPTGDIDGPVQATGRRKGVFTFLLLGRDTGGGGNTDTMMVATYDTMGQTVDVMNIYRDTMVNAPWDIKRINSVYNANGGGEEGIRVLSEYLRDLIGFAPDYYITVEWNAVGELVDAIGGVEFDVPYEMHYWDPTQNLRIDQAKGLRTLTGEDAMQVIRWRKNNDGSGVSVGDIGRVSIQQDFLKAVLEKCLHTIHLSTVPRYAQILLDNVTTDLPLGSIVWLGQKALGMDMESLRFHSLPGNLNGAAWSRTVGNYQSYVLPSGDEIVELVNEYFNPYEEEISLSDLDIMSVNADGSLSSSRGVVRDTKAALPPVKPTAEPEPSAEPEEPVEEPEAPTGEPESPAGEPEGDTPTGQVPAETAPPASGSPGGETTEPPDEEPPAPTSSEEPTEPDPPAETPAGGPEETHTTQVLPAMPTPA